MHLQIDSQAQDQDASKTSVHVTLTETAKLEFIKYEQGQAIPQL